MHCSLRRLLGSKRQRMSHMSTTKHLKYLTNAHFLKKASQEEIHDWSSDDEQSEDEPEAQEE